MTVELASAVPTMVGLAAFTATVAPDFVPIEEITGALGGVKSITKLYPLFAALVELPALSVAVTQTYHVPAARLVSACDVELRTEGGTG